MFYGKTARDGPGRTYQLSVVERLFIMVRSSLPERQDLVQLIIAPSSAKGYV